MRIAERFDSIQGEGKLTGVPSAFIRASGCNLRCSWCDTHYASWKPEGGQQSVDELVSWVGEVDRKHVVFTGGEPVIQPDAEELCDRLTSDGRHITLETAGTVFKPLAIDLLSLSPKLANSTPSASQFADAHERQRLDFEAMNGLISNTRTRRGDVQVKFVVASPGDVDELGDVVDRLENIAPDDVLLMPEGTDTETLVQRSGWLAELCKSTGYRFCPRLHVFLYGDTRGT
ncbi:MAG: 7-carboxy-7-deazaguanine synthase QueE [Planctomycetota bacterium]